MAHIYLPAYPSFTSADVTVDPEIVGDFATKYCRATRSPSGPDFYYSHLPLTSVDQVFRAGGEPAAPTLAELLGNVYVSGYFGGGWLTGILFGPGGPDGAVGDAGQLLRTIASRAENPSSREYVSTFGWLYEFLQSILGDAGTQWLVDLCGREISFASSAKPADLLSSLPDRLSRLVALCGFNLGFLRQMRKHKHPSGLDRVDYGRCLLDFTSPSVTIVSHLFSYWLGVIPRLLDPRPGNLRWLALQRMQEGGAALGEPLGEMVWKCLLGKTNLSGSGYDTLYDLGVKYQLLAQTVTLAGMSAWANQDAKAGQLAIILEACFILWSGEFVIGRFSDNSSQPTIACD